MPYLETEEEAAERIADFHEKKRSGHVNLPILLSKIYTNNSSKKLTSNVKQLINNLYKNKIKFEYSPIGKVFTDGLAKEDKSKRIGLFKRLKNIEDNLIEVDDNDNKVGIFRIIKDIKDRDIKIDNDDEAVREIRERIKELIDNGVKVNDFNERKEIMEHIKHLKEQGFNVRVDEGQNNDFINKISDIKNKDNKNKYIGSEIDKFLKNYGNINIIYNKNKFNTEEITKSRKKLHNKIINFNGFNEEYNKFMDNVIKFEYYKSEKEPGSISPNQRKNEQICKKFKRYC